MLGLFGHARRFSVTRDSVGPRWTRLDPAGLGWGPLDPWPRSNPTGP